MANYGWLYGLISVYAVASGSCAAYAYRQNKVAGNDSGTHAKPLARERFERIGAVFTLSASLFSGYTVEGIAWEAWLKGWFATRWIPAGVACTWAFWSWARLNALGKSRRYLTLSEFVYDRFSAPNSRNQATAHALRVLTWGSLLLPIFCYQSAFGRG